MVIHRVLVVQPLHPTAIAMLDARADVSYTVVTDLSDLDPQNDENDHPTTTTTHRSTR